MGVTLAGCIPWARAHDGTHPVERLSDTGTGRTNWVGRSARPTWQSQVMGRRYAGAPVPAGAQSMSESVTFKAAFPAIQSAIKVYGDKQGMRVQLDIPESEMGAALSLLLWRECALEITVRPVTEMGAAAESDDRPKRTKPYL
jgi:hypothetical protein